MEVTDEVSGRLAIYRIVGRIDALTAPNLQSAIGPAIRDGNPRIIFDMRQVTYISSAGLRVVVLTAKQAKAANGGLAVFGLQSAVKEVFEISGIGNIVPIASDETEARLKVGA